MNSRRIQRYWMAILALCLMGMGLGWTQAQAESGTPYNPQFAGDPARSDSEAQALGYMRVVLRAENTILSNATAGSLYRLSSWRARNISTYVWRTVQTAEIIKSASVPITRVRITTASYSP